MWQGWRLVEVWVKTFGSLGRWRRYLEWQVQEVLVVPWKVQAVPNVADQVWQVQNQIAERRPLAET